MMDGTYNQLSQHRSGYQRLRELGDFQDYGYENLPEAVKMMLPPVSSFPTEGLTFSIASEACLTARKHLSFVN